MALKDLAPRITADPGIRPGKPVIKDTRMPVEAVAGKMASGMTRDEVAAAYGTAGKDILAALAYAAATVPDWRILTAQVASYMIDIV